MSDLGNISTYVCCGWSGFRMTLFLIRPVVVSITIYSV